MYHYYVSRGRGRSASYTVFVCDHPYDNGALAQEASDDASAVPKVRGNGRCEDVILFDGVFFEPSLKSIFFVS